MIFDIPDTVAAGIITRTRHQASVTLNGSDLPCHRVVNRFGALTGRMHWGDPNLMEDLLKSEGIEFTEEGIVNIDKHLWKP